MARSASDRSRACGRLALLLLALAGCGEDFGLVAVTVTAQPSLAGVTRLTGEAFSGDRRVKIDIALGGPRMIPPEGKFGIDAPTGPDVLISLSALDVDGAVLATGQTHAAVKAGGRTDVTLLLAPPGAPLDGGIDALVVDGGRDAAPDLAPPDLALPDLALPDFAVPDVAVPDLALPDFALPDFALPDLALPDLATPDLVVRDSTVAVDLVQLDLNAGPLCSQVTVTTLAGNGVAGFVDGSGGASGTTRFDTPHGVAVDGAGNVYVADQVNHRIRKVTSLGATSTLAGNGGTTFVDGTGGAAGTTTFNLPAKLAFDGTSLFVADYNNNRIRKVASDGTTTTLAGNGNLGSVDGTGGPGGTAQFNHPQGIAVRGTTVYVGDSTFVRLVAASGTTTTLAGNGLQGFVDGSGGPTGSTQFNNAVGVAADSAGVVYVADQGNCRIRKVALNGSTTTLAGNGSCGSVDGTGGPSGSAQFNQPLDVAVDGAGNVYVAEAFGRVRVVAPNGDTRTVAGTGVRAFLDGNGCVAQLHTPSGIAVSGKLLFIADGGDHRIRQLQLP